MIYGQMIEYAFAPIYTRHGCHPDCGQWSPYLLSPDQSQPAQISIEHMPAVIISTTRTNHSLSLSRVDG